MCNSNSNCKVQGACDASLGSFSSYLSASRFLLMHSLSRKCHRNYVLTNYFLARDFHVVLFLPATSARRSSWKASSPENGNPTAVLSHDTWYMTIPSHKIIGPKTNIRLSNFCISSEELTKLHYYVYISTRSLHPLHLQQWLACWPCRSLAVGAEKEEFNDE